jgi:replicative DNA helicase
MSDTTPRADEAEADLLCAILMSQGRALDDIDLRPEEMYLPAHATILSACHTLHANGIELDATTVSDSLLKRGELDHIGGPIVLAKLISRGASTASASFFARIVRERATRRTIIQVGTRLQQMAANPTDDTSAAIEDARHEIDDLADRVHGAAEPNLEDDLDATMDAMERGVATLHTPWSELDHLIGGWRKGAIYVVAARPGGGKSIFGEQVLIDAMLRHDVPGVFQSLEMTRTEVHQRAFSQLGAVNLADIVKGGKALDDEQWRRIARARGRMSETRFVVDDRTSLTVADIRASIARCKRRHGSCGLVVVDYLQLLSGSKKAENRQVEVASFSRDLKVAAKQLEVPIVVLAQLNRGPESEKRPPRMSDLRESGAVEQDGDVIILLHRDEEQAPDVLNVGIAKNRHGPKGSFTLAWQGEYSRLKGQRWTPTGMVADTADAEYEPERAA